MTRACSRLREAALPSAVERWGASGARDGVIADQQPLQSTMNSLQAPLKRDSANARLAPCSAP